MAQYERPIKSNMRLGLNYGHGSLRSFPFRTKGYTYESRFYKIQFSNLINTHNKWEISINIEPSIYINTLQTLAYDFIQNNAEMGRVDNLMQTIEFSDFALNIGIQFNYRLVDDFSAYFLSSIGPTITEISTKRLSKGLAFTSTAAVGLNLDTKPAIWDLRLSLRHVSNAGMNIPNKGYNSMNLEVGFKIPLKARQYALNF